MTAEPVELRAVLEGLADYGVDFIVFGAVAMLFYGHVRNTEDIDIVIASSEDNLSRVHDWLVANDARLKLRPSRRFGPRERWAMQKGSNATVITRHGQIDVVQRIEGMPAYGTLVDESEVYERDGVEVRVMNRATLIELKRRRSDKQDLADIEAIELLDELD